MKKWFLKPLALWFILVSVLTACSPATVPEGYDEGEVILRAEEIVTLLAEGDYQAVASSFREDLQAQLSAEQLEAAVKPEMERVGALKEIIGRDTSTVDVEDLEYALVVLTAEHDNSRATYTITMDKEGRLLGLFMR